MKIPFDIKFRPQIESGEYKVETRHGGNPIRILAWDLPYDFPIATAEFTEDNRVIVESYSTDGWVGYGERENNLVIITPEPELTEFEKAVLNLCEDMFQGPVGREEAKKRAKELLEIAREELFAELKEYAETARERGKAEVLKDLPRWKKCEGGGFCHERFRVWRTLNGEYYLDQIKQMQIAIKDLEKLPRFKEE